MIALQTEFCGNVQIYLWVSDLCPHDGTLMFILSNLVWNYNATFLLHSNPSSSVVAKINMHTDEILHLMV